MVAKVAWKGGMEFSGDAKSGFSLDLSAAVKVGGAEDGFRPMELMALGLAGCVGMDVISILNKKRQVINALEVHVHPEFANTHPYVWTRVHIEILIAGDGVDPNSVQRAIELSSTKYCPAQNILDEAVEIETTFRLFEGESIRA